MAKRPGFSWQFPDSASARSSPARIGPYEIVAELGAGGMAVVYRVRDGSGRDLALKLLAGPGSGESARLRLAREGEVTASLRHPGIVTVHDAGVDGGRPYLVYELLEGSDLEQRLPGLDRDSALRIVHEVALALAYAHERGVIHRDLKPSNILIDAAGRAHIADFGLAQAAGLERLTQTGAMVGTPVAMAPEQAAGERERYGPHTDVWALGVLLYRVLTGEDIFPEAVSLVHLLVAIREARVLAPSKRDPTVSAALDAVCLKALEKRPEDRYADAGAFARDLQKALTGRKALSRDQRLSAALAAVGLIAVSLLVWSATPEARKASADGAAPPAARPEGRALLEASVGKEPELPAALAALKASSVEGSARLLRCARDLARTGRLDELADLRRAVALEALGAAQRGESARARSLLVALAQAGAPDRSGVEDQLVSEVLSLARHSLEDDSETALRLLNACADAGLRVRDRLLGSGFMEFCLFRSNFQSSEHLYWRLVLVISRLDIPASGAYLGNPNDVQAAPDWPWPRGLRDPWKRYVELRVLAQRANTGPAHRALLELLLDPKPPIQLGPCHWSDSAARLAMVSSLETARELLEEAERRDPLNPYVHRSWARVFLAEGRREDALRSTLRALECFPARTASKTEHFIIRGLLVNAVRLQARLNRRYDARRSYVNLKAFDPPFAQYMVDRYPWLVDPQ